MASGSTGLMDMLGITFFVHTALGLFLACLLIPTFMICYPFVKWSRKCWVRFVKWRYPNCTVVEEASIRSILDQGRNQGIYTLLVQGQSIAEGARGHLLHLTSTKSILRSALTTKWGLYVWRNNPDFSIDDHLIKAPCSFRGRPITESNIQEFVSDLTSKYLPRHHSPWQVHVINCSLNGEESRVCLVRAHHLILRQGHFTLADFLPLKYSPENWACQESDSPFTNLFAEPSALPRLHQKLTESFSNYWNEFLCNNDPTERPEIMKKQIGLFQCTKIAIIIWVSTVKEITRCYKKLEGFRITYSIQILRREASKRNFELPVVFRAFLHDMNPLGIIYSAVTWIWYMTVTLTLKTPILIFRELRALRSSQKHLHPDTLTCVLSCYLPLMLEAAFELFSITGIIVTAPKMIIEELFFKCAQANRLQTISSCGRKIVAWSEEVNTDIVHKISSVTGATDAEILLAATAGSFKEYFRQSGLQIPQQVLATAKLVSQRALFVRNHEARGILCLSLPTRTPLFDDNLIETLQVIQKNVQEARSRQSAIYAISSAESTNGLLSSCLPALPLKLALNYLTSRYSLSLTHVDGDLLVEGVDAAMYWKPPQGNCSMSVTLHRHGNGVRLGVMVDAMIGPRHSIITRAFPRSFQELALAVGVPRTPSRSPSPDSASSPTTSPGY